MKSKYEIKKVEPGKTRITIRLDNTVLAWFKGKAEESRGSYQLLIDEVLQKHVAEQNPDEHQLRRIIREELGQYQMSSHDEMITIPYVQLSIEQLMTAVQQLEQDAKEKMAQLLFPNELKLIDRQQGILNGEPIISGTRTPVRAIVELWNQGVLPQIIPEQLPHLSLAQVFDALSYYTHHQDEIDLYIATNKISNDEIHPVAR